MRRIVDTSPAWPASSPEISANRQSALIRRICSIVRARDSRRRGLATMQVQRARDGDVQTIAREEELERHFPLDSVLRAHCLPVGSAS